MTSKILHSNVLLTSLMESVKLTFCSSGLVFECFQPKDDEARFQANVLMCFEDRNPEDPLEQESILWT